MIYFIPYGIYQDLITPGGLVASNMDDFAVAAGAILVVVVNLQVSTILVVAVNLQVSTIPRYFLLGLLRIY